MIGGLKCQYFSRRPESSAKSREDELGNKEDDGVGDLLHVREGENGRGLHRRNAAVNILVVGIRNIPC